MQAILARLRAAYKAIAQAAIAHLLTVLEAVESGAVADLPVAEEWVVAFIVSFVPTAEGKALAEGFLHSVEAKGTPALTSEIESLFAIALGRIEAMLGVEAPQVQAHVLPVPSPNGAGV